MDKDLFADLTASLKEAASIAKGQAFPSRSFKISGPDVKQGRRSIWQRRGTWHRNMNVLYRAELRENERRKIWREI